ncbi:MAG: dihydrodipicolinate synthase family protein [Candidatus Dormiibacterota bacterium]
MPVELGAGAYGILLTTYDDADRILHRDLTAQAEFVASTAQGVVWPVMASEFYLLSADEIEAGFPAVVEGVAGRVPFVAGVSQLTTRDAVRLTKAAAKAGADAVIAMPPYLKKAVGEDLVAYFRAIAEVGLPIVVQNHNAMGTAGPMSVEELRQLAETFPEVQHLKEEAPVLPGTITRVLRALPGAYRHILSGGGGRFLVDELRRGGSGTMAACEWVDLLGAVYRAWERGDEAEARRLHDRVLPGIVLELAYGMPGAKEVLRRRGITRSATSRLSAGSSLDEWALQEIDATLSRLADVLPWGAGVAR